MLVFYLPDETQFSSARQSFFVSLEDIFAYVELAQQDNTCGQQQHCAILTVIIQGAVGTVHKYMGVRATPSCGKLP